ncbi:Proteasome maturation factor UMP1, partial [Pseudocercospora fuligena]
DSATHQTHTTTTSLPSPTHIGRRDQYQQPPVRPKTQHIRQQATSATHHTSPRLLTSTSIMSLRIVPAPSHPSITTPNLGAPSAPGVHDTLRANLSLSTSAPKASAPSNTLSSHPLESRLSQWRTQQENLKMEMLRRQFGIAEPVKRQMELQIVRAGEWRPAVFGATAGLHADILSGRDCEIGWEDVFTGEEMRESVDFHVEMEGRFRMGEW